MSHPEETGDYEEAGDAGENPGACPPYVLKFRIYPEINFTTWFGNPPPNVQP